jgi:hypothetical protein
LSHGNARATCARGRDGLETMVRNKTSELFWYIKKIKSIEETSIISDAKTQENRKNRSIPRQENRLQEEKNSNVDPASPLCVILARWYF